MSFPPSPDAYGSATPRANDTATAASMALPPAWSVARPILAACGCPATTIAWRAKTVCSATGTAARTEPIGERQNKIMQATRCLKQKQVILGLERDETSCFEQVCK